MSRHRTIIQITDEEADLIRLALEKFNPLRQSYDLGRIEFDELQRQRAMLSTLREKLDVFREGGYLAGYWEQEIEGRYQQAMMGVIDRPTYARQPHGYECSGCKRLYPGNPPHFGPSTDTILEMNFDLPLCENCARR